MSLDAGWAKLQFSPLMMLGRTLDNSTAVDVSADRLTTAWARQMRLSLTGCGSGNAVNGLIIVGSMMQQALRLDRAIG